MSGREFIRLDTDASGEFSVAGVPTEPNLATGSFSPVLPWYTLLDFEVAQVSRQRLRLQRRQSIFPTRKGAQRRAQTGDTLRGGESYTMRCARWLKQ